MKELVIGLILLFNAETGEPMQNGFAIYETKAQCELDMREIKKVAPFTIVIETYCISSPFYEIDK